MPEFDSLNTTDPSVSETLAFLSAFLAKSERNMLAMDARWLLMGEDDPEICGNMADLAARSICRQPAIVWG